MSKGAGSTILVFGLAVVVLSIVGTGPWLFGPANPSSQPLIGVPTPDTAPTTTPATYVVTFSISGLAPDTLWQLGVAPLGSSYFAYTNSTSASMERALPNGSYVYVVSTPANYSADIPSPAFTVDGAALGIAIHFGAGYPITFVMSGLPAGLPWFLDLRNASAASNVSVVGNVSSAYEPAGTYNFSVYADGYTSVPSNGSVTVPSASSIVVDLAFASTPEGYLSGIISVFTAQIWIDGIPHGFTAGGGFTYVLAPGVYDIIASASGYATFSGYAQVKSGQTTNIYIVLNPSNIAASPTSGRLFTAADGYVVLGLGVGLVAFAGAFGYAWMNWRPAPKRASVFDK